MKETKEKILLTALKLFAQDGYGAVSTGDIANTLGMAKSSLYTHYKNKQDIFDAIVARMIELDQARAKNFDVPEEIFEKTPEAYQNNSLDQIKFFIEAQFRFWTEDEFARDFRKMMTIEQYRNPQMADLYQKIFASGPVRYTEDIFREMIEAGKLARRNPALMAIEFFAPFHLLMSFPDTPAQEDTTLDLLMQCAGRFIRQNAVE